MAMVMVMVMIIILVIVIIVNSNRKSNKNVLNKFNYLQQEEQRHLLGPLTKDVTMSHYFLMKTYLLTSLSQNANLFIFCLLIHSKLTLFVFISLPLLLLSRTAILKSITQSVPLCNKHFSNFLIYFDKF